LGQDKQEGGGEELWEGRKGLKGGEGKRRGEKREHGIKRLFFFCNTRTGT
jgi:hypothetical protein